MVEAMLKYAGIRQLRADLADTREQLRLRQLDYEEASERASSLGAMEKEGRAELEVVRGALSKINDIRNSIIGTQNVNWSAHIYPLVRALEEAGIPGDGYEKANKLARTLIEHRDAALARAESAEAERDEAKGNLADVHETLAVVSEGRAKTLAELDEAQRRIAEALAWMHSRQGEGDDDINGACAALLGEKGGG